MEGITIRTIRYNTPLFFMLSDYSLSHNKETLTCTVVTDYGFSSTHGVLSELRIECQVNLIVFKALMSLALPPML